MSLLPLPKKELGQHFLRDQKVIKTITDDCPDECDYIIEVGPGPGILTKSLAEKNKPFSVIEKDTRFKEYLQKYLDFENIYFQDALKFDWESFILRNNLKGKKIWLVSNLPYNVGTVLFTQFIQISEIFYMTLMFQKEVGDKTYAKKHAPQMNGLFFLSQTYFESQALIKVLPGSFTPPPKVDSIVVSYKRIPEPKIDLDNFSKLDKFTRKLFGMKRKQLGKVLKSHFTDNNIEQILLDLSIEKSRRAETLSYSEVLKIAHATFLHDD